MPIRDVQQTNKQHAVPQNIMDVEFKVIGELTLRQFAYLLVFWGTAYLVAVYMSGLFKWPLAVFCTLMGLGLAFIPIQERGMDQWVVNFIKAMYTPNQKIWKKDPVVPSAFLYQNMAVVRQELITLAPTSSRRKLEEFLEKEESRQKLDKLDIAEQGYIRMVRAAYAGDTTESASVSVETEPITPVKFDMDFGPAQQKVEQEPEAVFEPIPTVVAPEPSTFSPPAPPPVQPTPPQVQKPQAVSATVPARPPLEIKHSKIKLSKPYPEYSSTDILLSPMTPDRHAGRKFMSLLPKQGQLILPFRGGKVIKTDEENDFEEDLKAKTEQLNILISQIKTDKNLQKNLSRDLDRLKGELAQSAPSPGPAKPDEVPDMEGSQRADITAARIIDTKDEGEVLSLIDSFKVEFERLTKKIVRLRADIDDTGGMERPENVVKKQLLEKLERQKLEASKEYEEIQAKTKEMERLLEEQKKQKHENERVSQAYVQKVEQRKAEDYEILKKRVAELQEMLKQKEAQEQSAAQALPVQEAEISEEKGPATARYAKMQPLTGKPNVISGIVKSPEGAGLEGIVVVIKNDRAETVRAIKTNALGQFVLLTSLSNGRYNIEMDQYKKSGYSFDIISVEAKGEVVPPIEFIGRY